jgi:tetratricopeptide (TPR) repeat protein
VTIVLTTPLLFFWASGALADAVLDRAQQLLRDKQPAAAFELLLPLESQRAGETEYDYLLGIAALDAGDPQRAVFALERVLAVNPNYLQARAEIARAYFVLGERDSARQQFAAVRAENPPEAARRTIDQYLAALAPQARPLRAYIELAAGRDSNVNAATGRSGIAIPALGGTIGQLNPLAVKQAANFLAVGGGVSVDYGFNDEWAGVGAVNAYGKFNHDASEFNTQQYDLSAGGRWRRDRMQVLGLVQGQNFRLDNANYRESRGGVLQGLYRLDESQELSAFAQYATLRYPDQSVRNSDRTIGGVAYSRALATWGAPIVYLSTYGGEDKQRDPSFPQVGNKPFGVRIGGQLTLSDQSLLFANASYEYRRYNGPEPLFLTTRVDNQYDFRIGLNFVPAAYWTISPQFAYTDNRSNIELYAYIRMLGFVSLRRDFW